MTRRLVCAAVAIACAAGCSASDSSGGSTSLGATDSGNDVDALVCSPLGGNGDPSCPATFGVFDCSSFHFLDQLSCSSLDAYDTGFGIDTSTRCYYDPTSHALIGVSYTANVFITCNGTIDASCTGATKTLCVEGDAGGD